uniref:Ankyrin repeat domain 22 n=1 Tax=Sinocyclocheilus anshuiensis TaxID=1608454 RepID=A0A671MS31_9TELE
AVILYMERPMCQAAYDDDIHKLQKLISADPRNVNVQDEGTGDTPIIAACRQGNLRTVKYLLDCNANVSIRNKKERTCLHYATRRTFSFLDYLMIAILMPILLIGYLIMVGYLSVMCTGIESVLCFKGVLVYHICNLTSIYD